MGASPWSWARSFLHEMFAAQLPGPFPFAYAPLTLRFLLVFLAVLVIGRSRPHRPGTGLGCGSPPELMIAVIHPGQRVGPLSGSSFGILTKRSFDSAGQLLLIRCGHLDDQTVIAFPRCGSGTWTPAVAGGARRPGETGRGHAFRLPRDDTRRTSCPRDLVPAVSSTTWRCRSTRRWRSGPTDVSAIRGAGPR